jgi:hypothetical protein
MRRVVVFECEFTMQERPAMSSLSRQEKQLIFDYCFGLMAMEKKQRAESLISTNRLTLRRASELRWVNYSL